MDGPRPAYRISASFATAKHYPLIDCYLLAIRCSELMV
jgi:hypothetical protein